MISFEERLEKLAEPLTAREWDSSHETTPLANTRSPWESVEIEIPGFPSLVVIPESFDPAYRVTAADLEGMVEKLPVWDQLMIILYRIWRWFR